MRPDASHASLSLILRQPSRHIGANQLRLTYTATLLISHTTQLAVDCPLSFDYAYVTSLPAMNPLLFPPSSFFLFYDKIPRQNYSPLFPYIFFFFLNDTAPPEFSPLPLHDPLPI